MVQRKYFKGKNTLKNHNSQLRSKRRSRSQRGGDTGRYVFPQAFFGNGTKGYGTETGFPTGSKQLAVSSGTIHSNGKYAGANLYPQNAGNSCGCNKNNSSQHKSHRRSIRNGKKGKKGKKGNTQRNHNSRETY